MTHFRSQHSREGDLDLCYFTLKPVRIIAHEISNLPTWYHQFWYFWDISFSIYGPTPVLVLACPVYATQGEDLVRLNEAVVCLPAAPQV